MAGIMVYRQYQAHGYRKKDPLAAVQKRSSKYSRLSGHHYSNGTIFSSLIHGKYQ
jgi:hypothetical protein